ncbi:hypothetical protein CDV31_004021 [Fusarium ambrosium]|uniref:Uncharacterized protein n=1 Tax=Fusarium ambrosium TaxID=131363 RepID=A0A428US63_9HYPO|nr:hypothetical protein CDV31_004021 [Fusarium ambrosium]
MSNNGETKSPFDFTEAGKRPRVEAYAQKLVFTVGEGVYLLKIGGSREGPYIVAIAPVNGKCTLSYGNGQPFRNNEQINVDDLESNAWIYSTSES